MSRDRPTELPRAVIVGDEPATRLATLQRSPKLAFGHAIGAMFDAFSRIGSYGGSPLPFSPGPLSRQRAEAILRKLNAFYAQRPRPWRPASHAPKTRRRRIAYNTLARKARLDACAG